MKNSILFFLILFFSCQISFAQKNQFRQMTQPPLRIHLGDWRGTLTLNDTTELPFTFTVDMSPEGYILTTHNGEENILVENLIVTKDSVNWRMPIFDSWFKCKIDSLGGFHGTFFNRAASHPYDLKFRAEYNLEQMHGVECFHQQNFSGKWECTFSPGIIDSSMAIGIFSQKKEKISGTFLTETGDYRFLEGAIIHCDEMELSTFDGSHAFVFKATISKDGSLLHGNAWYGKFGHEKWIGKRNDNFQLRDPEKLTYVVDSTKINFTFNDLNGNPVSLSDSKFKGKVVIVQIMGSWCPNCMDETEFLNDVYKKYNSQGLEIIGLAYERSSDTAIANANIRRLQKHFDVDYTLLNTGKSGRDSASASLAFLNGILSFPTTIYIDKNGKVRKVFTGYNGPATGVAYEKDSAETLRFIQQLLAEKK